MKQIFFIVAAVALISSCSTTKKVQDATSPGVEKVDNAAQQQLNYVRKVNDNAVYSKNIVAKMDLGIDAMGKSINVDGKIYMRKDEVIRLVVAPFGLMEVGRLEFTPDYVLLINRLEKEYVKATYNDLDFLKNNGMSFYTLQSLFWNQFFVPAKKTLTEGDLSRFSADMNVADGRPVTLQSDKLLFTWITDVTRALITKADITYGKGTSMASSIDMEYKDFVPMGSKKFPSSLALSFKSKAANQGKMTLSIQMSKISNEEGWETRSTVSDKYKEVKAEALFQKLLNM